jgi:hypothetical protein
MSKSGHIQKKEFMQTNGKQIEGCKRPAASQAIDEAAHEKRRIKTTTTFLSR